MAEGEEGATGSEESEESQEEEKKGPANIADALARAREVLADRGTMMGMADEAEEEEEESGKTGEKEEQEVAEEEVEEEVSEAGEEEEEVEGEEAEEVEEEVEEEGAEEEEVEEEEEKEEEEEEKKDEPITVSVPGRQPDDEDLEIEVDDQELAERINHLKNGFLRGEEVREREAQLNVAQDKLEEISESFEVDPAGFLMEYVDKEEMPQVVLALLTQPGVWDKLSATVDKLFSDTGELRTLQAETKAARLEAKDKLKDRAAIRKEHAKNGRELAEAIELMVPEEVVDKQREQLISDLTRDTRDHIDRNKLPSLAVKDLVTVLASRLETNGIDPLVARKAVQNGSRSRGKLSTKKGPKKKPKTGQELAKASAKRKRVAAAPGPGKKAAPAQPTKLPAGMTIKESIALARKKGFAALLPEK